MANRIRTGSGAAAFGASVVTGTAIALAPHPWLYVLLGVGILVTAWGLLPLLLRMFHGGLSDAESQGTDNRGGAFAGRDNSGIQQVFHGPVTVNHASSRGGDVHLDGGTGGLILRAGDGGLGGPGGPLIIKAGDAVGSSPLAPAQSPLKPIHGDETNSQIPLHEAAIRLHEAEESEGVTEDPPPSSLSPADRVIEHLKYVLLTAAREERITLWGTHPPSRNSIKLQVEEIAQHSPAPGASRLNPAFASGAGIVDVWISEADLQSEIKYRIDLLKRLSGGI